MYDTDCEQYSCERDACPCGHHRGHGVFFAHGAISLSAGGAVPLTARYADAQCFSCSYGNILIRRPGLYYAAVTMDVPGDCPISTVIRLELDNQAVCPPEIPVDTGCGGPAANFAGHTVFHARAGSLLKLSSLEAISLPDSGRQSFTLTLFRLN